MTVQPKKMSHKKLIGMLGLIAVGMFGFGFAMVPLYTVFCEALGIKLSNDGTGRIAEGSQFSERFATDEERWITVQFDSAVDRGLAWEFGPEEKFMKVKIGEQTETTYFAHNLSDAAVTGHAVPSVAPSEASIYFAKTECFCFTQQRLEGDEKKDMPVRFIIDPAIPDHIKVVTLSYRFYNTEQEDNQVTAN